MEETKAKYMKNFMDIYKGSVEFHSETERVLDSFNYSIKLLVSMSLMNTD